MRTGWLVMLGWVAVLAALFVVGWATMRPGDKPEHLVLPAYACWIGMGATAAVMLSRGAGTTYGRAIEGWVLKGIAFAGLAPLFLLLLFAVFGGWAN